MMGYLAICTRLPGNELIPAECENLTGGKPDANGVAFCKRVDLIPRSAFVQTGLRLIARAPTLAELAATIARETFPADDFRIELLRTEGALPIKRQEAIVTLANALEAYPDLDEPRHRFLLITMKDELAFCEIIAECEHDYQQHATKPYHTSSSLDARLARGMVNLVSPPAQSILDPCCGTGSILLEAQALELRAFGGDRNPRMVGMARKNLARYGYQAEVRRMDAQEWQQGVDAVVTDLPYGYMQVLDPENMRGILANCTRLAPVGVFAAGMDISTWLMDAGYSAVEVFPVQKTNRFVRYIHRALIK